MRVCVLDFETHYTQQYSLSKITTEEYVRSPLFEVIGLAYKFDDQEVVWLPQPEVEAWIKAQDWSDTMIVAQNVLFDGAILAWRYGVRPKAWADTLGMSRAMFPHEKQHGLKYQAIREGIGEKGTEVENFIGYRYADFSPEQLQRYADYCCQDVFLTHMLFTIYMNRGFPIKELRLIDMTTRMFTEPVLALDAEGLQVHLARVIEAKAKLLDTVRDTMLEGADPEHVQAIFSEGAEGIKKVLMSNDKFASMLEMVGVIPPTKVSPKTGKRAYAFAKTDEEFKALEEHPNPVVQALVAARLGNKTTLEETRTARFIGMAGRGAFPVPLRYYGAATGRWCLTGEHEVLTPTGWVRLDCWDGQPIRQWNPDTKALTWCVTPTVSSFFVNEPLVCFNGDYHKARYTREHRIPIKKRHLPNTPKDILAKDLATKAKKELYVSGYIPTDGAPPTAEEIAQLRLIVAMHADGYNVEDDKNNMVRFRFVKRRKVERLEGLLEALGIPYLESQYPSEPGVYAICIPGRYAPAWLRSAKQLPQSWYMLDAARAEIILQELVEWDGYRSGPNSIEWCGTDRSAAVLLATLAHLTGRRAKWVQRDRLERRWATTYRLSITPTETVTEYGANATEQLYSGLVFCPTVDTGYFLCRGHDTIFITGNSGQDSVNLQNLPSRGKNAKSIKKCIVAPPGKLVIDCDSSQIEARCLAWEAGQEDLLRSFRERADVYSAMASKIYGRPVNRKRVEVDPVTGKEFKPDQREGEVGKATILGCFGADTLVLTQGGWKRIIEVQSTDMVWDGEEWVTHRGLLPQGEKTVWTSYGISATADHAILTEHGWKDWSEVCTDPHLFQSAISKGSSPLSDGIAGSTPRDAPQGGIQSYAAVAGGKGTSTTSSAASTLSKQRMLTYDIAYAGPRNRFTILSEQGPLVVHNCGYGMGGSKFQLYLKTMGIAMEEDECGRVIATYRTSVPRITELWERAGEALDAMIRGQTYTIDLNGAGICKVVAGNRITLPSGLTVHYPELAKRLDVDKGKYETVYMSKGLPVRIYGPKVIENITQAIARCVVAEQALRVAKRYRVAMMVHDSVVAVVSEAEKAEAMAYITECMSWVPPWASGLPLDCEAGAAKSYGDC